MRWVGAAGSAPLKGGCYWVFFFCIPVVCCFGEDIIPASIPAGFRGTLCVCRRAGLRVPATCWDSGAPSSCLNVKMFGLLDTEKLIF